MIELRKSLVLKIKLSNLEILPKPALKVVIP